MDQKIVKKELNVTAISDLHGYLPSVSDFPAGDVLCICGDIVPLKYQLSGLETVSWLLQKFTPWTDKLKDYGYKHVLVIPGNHDFFFESAELGSRRSGVDILKKLYLDQYKQHIVKLLCDSSVVIEGHKFYGTPWIPDLSRWAFYGNSSTLVEKFSRIPKKCEVLLTHTPPRIGSQGLVTQNGNWNYGKNFGCQELADTIRPRQIDWVLSGHVHSGLHEVETIVTDSGHETKMRNVSLLDEDYHPTYDPFTFKLTI
jgi:Icc-related predicted phosphoesterase